MTTNVKTHRCYITSTCVVHIRGITMYGFGQMEKNHTLKSYILIEYVQVESESARVLTKEHRS